MTLNRINRLVRSMESRANAEPAEAAMLPTCAATLALRVKLVPLPRFWREHVSALSVRAYPIRFGVRTSPCRAVAPFLVCP